MIWMENIIYDREKVLDTVDKENVLFIRLQFIDILGLPKNIVIPPSRLGEALDKGIPFDGSSIAGYATIEESDKVAKPDPASFVILPEEIDKRWEERAQVDFFFYALSLESETINEIKEVELTNEIDGSTTTIP